MIVLAALYAPADRVEAAPDVTWRELIRVKPARVGFDLTAEEFSNVVPPRSVPIEGIRTFGEALGDVYETFENPPETHYFFCTVYYTPRETGFTPERGFNPTKETRRNLGGEYFSVDFLKASSIEGFGEMAEAHRGQDFIKYTGTWGYHNRILGNRNNTLLDRESLAVHRGNPLFSTGTRVWILDNEFYNSFGAMRYQVGDTGGGLFRSQIDIYWGQDDPLGPGADVYRPASCDVAVRWIVPVLIWR